MAKKENEVQGEETAEITTPKFASKGADGTVISVKFGNGLEVNLDLATLSPEIQENLMVHGALQKIGDSYASAKGDYTFAVAAAEKVVKQLQDGQWTASRGSGESKPKSGELAQALANVKGLQLDAVTAAVEKATDEQRATWRKHPAVKAEIAKLRAEKAAALAAKASSENTSADSIVL